MRNGIDKRTLCHNKTQKQRGRQRRKELLRDAPNSGGHCEKGKMEMTREASATTTRLRKDAQVKQAKVCSQIPQQRGSL